MIPRLQFGHSELLAVPAVHGRSLFAEMVNRVCVDEASRPDAIVVEFSHDTVCAIMDWLKDLGVGPQSSSNIPCMLGLVKSNNRVHPRHREAAIRLQEIRGLPLHQIPAEVLHEKLNFAPTSLVCISTTDSLIEGIRTGLELDIPVFGIDLGNTANAERGSEIILDPILGRHDLSTYLKNIEAAERSGRDAFIDGRREFVMAARLKRILQQYRRVLFTCGLGHWSELQRLLHDAAVPSALEPSRSEGEVFQRIVVAPSIALRQMDLFPDLKDHYEACRRLPAGATDRSIDYVTFSEAKLSAAVQCVEVKDTDLTTAFARYLSNLCVLHQRRVPDLFMMLHASRVMISPAFAEALGTEFVTKAVQWTGPQQSANLPYLYEFQPEPEMTFPPHCQRVRLRSGLSHSAPFHLAHHQAAGPSANWQLPPLPDPADNDSDAAPPKRTFSWVWPPCESLLFATAYEGARIATRQRSGLRPEPFAGSLHEGVDLKATLRATIRGENRIQVKVNALNSCAWEGGGESDEPAVFLFEPEATAKGAHWESMLTCYGSDVRRIARNKARYDRVARDQGDQFVACVTFSNDRQPPAALREHVTALKFLHGIVHFGNPCLNPLQAARWLEASDYRRCPILQWNNVSNLFDFYLREHEIRLDRNQWHSSLIQLALPYAKKQLVVLLAPGQSIPPAARGEAARRNIRLEIVPLSKFSPQRIERIRHQYLVHPTDVDAMEYPAAMQAAFGESPAAHIDLLPEHVRAQLDRARPIA